MKITNWISDELMSSYQDTDFGFWSNDQYYVISLDDANEGFLKFLKQNEINSWAYITAWNPFSIGMPDEFNKQRQQDMLEELKVIDVCVGEGKGRNTTWPGEESYFIPGISKERAFEIGAKFGQNAILVSDNENRPVLEFLFTGSTIEICDSEIKIMGNKKE